MLHTASIVSVALSLGLSRHRRNYILAVVNRSRCHLHCCRFGARTFLPILRQGDHLSCLSVENIPKNRGFVNPSPTNFHRLRRQILPLILHH